MGILDRLLVREVLKTLAVALLILLLVLLATQFVKLLGRAASGGLAPDTVLSLLGYQAIKVVFESAQANKKENPIEIFGQTSGPLYVRFNPQDGPSIT